MWNTIHSLSQSCLHIFKLAINRINVLLAYTVNQVKPAPGSKRQYYCEICDKQLNGPTPYNMHMASKMHREEEEYLKSIASWCRISIRSEFFLDSSIDLVVPFHRCFCVIRIDKDTPKWYLLFTVVSETLGALRVKASECDECGYWFSANLCMRVNVSDFNRWRTMRQWQEAMSTVHARRVSFVIFLCMSQVNRWILWWPVDPLLEPCSPTPFDNYRYIKSL